MIDIQAFKCGEDFTRLRVLVGEYNFIVFGLQNVRVKIWYNSTPFEGDHYSFTQSHCFGAPPDISATYASTEEMALRKAMGTLQTYYPPENARPGEGMNSWLVENHSF
ncbi:MAG TPA: hypothetical protein VGN16_00910 [Acidobacteriaceae bacterium]|jgi:hypothetical protein